MATSIIQGGPLPINRGGTGQTGTEKTTTISDIATASDNFTINELQFAHYGKLASIRMKVTYSGSTTLSGNNAVANINSGYRPAMNTGGVVWKADHMMYINTSGNVIINGSIAKNDEIVVFCTWMMA